MDVLGTAVGVASLGIQVCQGLLQYYNAWRSFSSDISDTYDIITDLNKCFVLLETSLQDTALDQERAKRVSECLQSCVASLEQLSRKADKLRRSANATPSATHKLRWELQRLQYPFRAQTLSKLKTTATGVQSRLQLAIQVLELDTSQRTLAAVHERASQIEARISAVLPSEQFQKIVDWIGPSDPWANHAAARQHHEPQTGDWLLRSQAYQDWKSGLIRHLWLYGKPGCGKTILCSTVIEDVKTYCAGHDDRMMAVFYFSFSEQRKQNYRDLLRSLVAQFGWREPGLSMLKQAKDLADSGVSPGPLSPSEMENIVVAALQPIKSGILILDALDESPEELNTRHMMLEGLERLAKMVPSLKVLASSRDVRDVREAMVMGVQAHGVFIATSGVDGDIRRYIANQLARDRRLARLDSATAALIEKTLTESANGMFRWAYCQLLQLSRLKSTKPKYILQALNTLPPTLDATYERILVGIDEMYIAEALTLLRWLAFSEGPLSATQLAEAAIIDPLADEGEEVDIANRGGLADTLDILAGLVAVTRPTPELDDDDYDDNEVDLDLLTLRIDEENICIRLAHFSVKEYLMSNRILDSKVEHFHLNSRVCHEVLAQSCLAYLLYYATCATSTTTKKHLPLLLYAAENWFIHFRHIPDIDVCRAVDLLDSKDACLSWMSVWRYGRYRCNMDSNGLSLYCASYLGLEKVISTLLNKGADVNERCNAIDGRFALHAAVDQEHESVLGLLLSRGADARLRDSLGNTALGLACHIQNKNVVRMLIDNGADVNSPSAGVTPLYKACDAGTDDVVQMLLDNGAVIDVRGGEHGTAMHAAIAQGNEKKVAMLLDHGANINAKDRVGVDCLTRAAARGHPEIVAMLLEHGAAVNGQDMPNRATPLVAAARSGHEQIMKMLLDHGAAVNACGTDIDSALTSFLRTNECSLGGIEMLLKRGANIEAGGSESDSPLAAASSHADDVTVFVRRLLERGADPDAPGGKFGPALHSAAIAGNKEIARLLLDHGANPNAPGGSYGSALQAAVVEASTDRPHRAMVQLLLDHGADPNIQGGEFGTPLQAAAWGGDVAIIRVLLQHGADPNALGGKHRSALQAAVATEFLDGTIIQLLLEHGADPNAQGGMYDNALQVAALRMQTNIMAILIDYGADPNIEGGRFGSVLQAAAWRGSTEVVKLLLERGSDPRARGGRYGSAMGAAKARQHRRVIKVLQKYVGDEDIGCDVGDAVDEKLSEDDIWARQLSP